jgi:hypothetical protein
MKYLATIILAGTILVPACQAQVQIHGVRTPSRDRQPPKSWQQIKAARAYLVASQNQDGSWGATTNRMRETSLALLGFTNSNVPGDYRPSVRKGIEWLLAAGEPPQVDLIAIRLIALSEIVNQSGDNLWPKVQEMIKGESNRVKEMPAYPWCDLLAIAPFPQAIHRPVVLPASWEVFDSHLNKELTTHDLSGIKDIRSFALATFASAHWSGPNSVVSAKAVFELWGRQEPNGSFPKLHDAYGPAGATGLMFLVNKGWMHCAYQYLCNERQNSRDKEPIQEKESSNQSVDTYF